MAQLRGPRRLAIAFSAAWLLFWAWVYIDDLFMSVDGKLSGFLLFGVLPVAAPWTAEWVWRGFRAR